MDALLDIFLFPEGVYKKRTKSKDEVHKDKQIWKFEVIKVKNEGAVSKNVERVAICPSSP